MENLINVWQAVLVWAVFFAPAVAIALAPARIEDNERVERDR